MLDQYRSGKLFLPSMTQEKRLFTAKPSLRRAYFYAFLYAGAVAWARFKTDLNPDFNPLWWCALGLLVVLLVFAHLRRLSTLYVITDREIRVSSGILSRSVAVAPHGRLTNVAAHQSFLERCLGMANLAIDTAGGDGAEVSFQRITREAAEAAGGLLREIMSKNTSSPGISAAA